MSEIIHKEIDLQGRILLPKSWRAQLKGKRVIVMVEENIVKIFSETKKLADFFDKAHPSKLKPSPFEDYEMSIAEASKG